MNRIRSQMDRVSDPVHPVNPVSILLISRKASNHLASPCQRNRLPKPGRIPDKRGMRGFRALIEPAGRLPSRRDWLRIGVPLVFGGALPSLQASSARGIAPGFGKAKSVLVVFTSGGQSQLDTWDPKPDAPEEVRGVFGTIPTAVPGLRVCEHLPRLAKLAHRYTVVRIDDARRPRPRLGLLPRPDRPVPPGSPSNPPPRPTDFPALGAVLTACGRSTASRTRRSTSTARC